VCPARLDDGGRVVGALVVRRMWTREETLSWRLRRARWASKGLGGRRAMVRWDAAEGDRCWLRGWSSMAADNLVITAEVSSDR